MARPGPRAGDYVKATDPPRLGLVLTVRHTEGRVELLLEDAGRDCDSKAEPAWVPAVGWSLVRRAGAADRKLTRA